MTARILLLSLAGALLAFAPPAAAQRRGEYLTEGEVALVREMRNVDNRTEVFLEVANRRLLALADPKAEYKDGRFRKYGPLPTGSQVELLDDYRRTIDELMIKLEDEFGRTGMTEKLNEALTFASTEIDRQIKALEALRPKLADRDAEQFVRKALEAARVLADGTRAALKKQ